MNLIRSHELPCFGMRGTIESRDRRAIGQRLDALREALYLNKAEFCRRAGITTPAFSNWVKSGTRPSLDEAIKICDEFDVTLDWIYFGDASRIPHDIAVAVRSDRRSEGRP